jgi:hypothetical protein
MTAAAALQQVHVSEERLESTIEELTRLEMAAHGFHAALSHEVKRPLAGAHAGSSSSSRTFEVAESRQQSSCVAARRAGRASFGPAAAAEASIGSADVAYRPGSRSSRAVLEAPQQQQSGAPERQRRRYCLMLQPCAFQCQDLHSSTCLQGSSSIAYIIDSDMHFRF